MVAGFGGCSPEMGWLPAIAALSLVVSRGITHLLMRPKNDMQLTFPFLNRAIWCAMMIACGIKSIAGQPTMPTTADKSKMPDWLTEFSVGVKETYDDNVLLVAGKTTPLNPIAMRPQDSWITTISPTVGLNFAPRLGGGKTFQTLSLVYAPDFVFFHEMPSENHNAHKIASRIKGQTGDFTFLLANDFNFTDGTSTAPTYGLGSSVDQGDRCLNAYVPSIVRERRKHIQDQAAVSLQYDLNKIFIRPAAALKYYDLMTDWHPNTSGPYTGYQNYVDRSDVNGGVDFGCKVTSVLAVTLGYRYGHQYQQSLPTNVYSYTVNGLPMQSSSDYQRLLLGLEGQPWKWLDIKLAGGPDFRTYNSAAPVDDYNPTTYYAEAVLTATLTPSQTLTFNYRQWQWVSSGGRIPYFDSTYALTYHWNATRNLGIDLGGKFLEGDYTVGSATLSHNLSRRDDAFYNLSAGVSYAFTQHFTTSLAYVCDLGRNLEPNLPANSYPEYREFSHQTISLSAKYKF